MPNYPPAHRTHGRHHYRCPAGHRRSLLNLPGLRPPVCQECSTPGRLVVMEAVQRSR